MDFDRRSTQVIILLCFVAGASGVVGGVLTLTVALYHQAGPAYYFAATGVLLGGVLCLTEYRRLRTNTIPSRRMTTVLGALGAAVLALAGLALLW